MNQFLDLTLKYKSIYRAKREIMKEERGRGNKIIYTNVSLSFYTSHTVKSVAHTLSPSLCLSLPLNPHIHTHTTPHTHSHRANQADLI